MRLTDEQLKQLEQSLHGRSLLEYRIIGKKYNRCDCGGVFEFVEANPPYNEIYLQCNKCDGTKIL
jgi:hypothetical protein